MHLIKGSQIELFSLEETYEALRTFQILAVERSSDKIEGVCKIVTEKLGSSSSTTEDIFYALKIKGVLGCQTESINFDVSL
jgi:oligosaccharyltransferase complex subunit delta (ribophorin II)